LFQPASVANVARVAKLTDLLTGICAPQFLRILDFRSANSGTNLSLPLRLGIGGVLSVTVPEVWGNGYSVTNSLLRERWIWLVVLMALAFKLVATALTTGSGAVAGVFTSTLFMGRRNGLAVRPRCRAARLHAESAAVGTVSFARIPGAPQLAGQVHGHRSRIVGDAPLTTLFVRTGA
jgi:H+/Cl- antiporter ClcA